MLRGRQAYKPDRFHSPTSDQCKRREAAEALILLIVRPLLTFPWTEVLVVSRERGVSKTPEVTAHFQARSSCFLGQHTHHLDYAKMPRHMLACLIPLLSC